MDPWMWQNQIPSIFQSADFSWQCSLWSPQTVQNIPGAMLQNLFCQMRLTCTKTYPYWKWIYISGCVCLAVKSVQSFLTKNHCQSSQTKEWLNPSDGDKHTQRQLMFMLHFRIYLLPLPRTCLSCFMLLHGFLKPIHVTYNGKNYSQHPS